MAGSTDSAPAQGPSRVLPAPEEKHRYVREMFDAIAPRYDLLNSVLSLRLHHRWRRAAVRQAALKPGDRALDVCTGTGDLAFALAQAVGASGAVEATDFSEPMLDLGRRKASQRGVAVRFSLADTQKLPFADAAFDAVTVGFGIRNVADIEAGLAEMARVVRPGGRVVVLEFTQPRAPLFAWLYGLYANRLLPAIGGLVSGKRAAYTYLPASVAAFHSREALASLMERAGLGEVRVTDLCLGVVAIHRGVKR